MNKAGFGALAILLAVFMLVSADGSRAQTGVSSACLKREGNIATVKQKGRELNVSINVTNNCKTAFKVVLFNLVSAIDNNGGSWTQNNPAAVSGISSIINCYEPYVHPNNFSKQCLEPAETRATELEPGAVLTIVFPNMEAKDRMSQAKFGDLVTLGITAHFKELEGRTNWRTISLGVSNIPLKRAD